MTTKTPLQLPAIFRGIRDNCDVRFTYTFKNGETGYVSGRFVKFSGRVEDDGTRVVTGIEVKPGFNSRIPDGARLTPEGNLRCVADRVTADPATGLVIPISKKEMANGTGGARYLLATDAQVRYALSLCGRDVPGGGNFYQPGEAEFRAMSRREVSEWIDMAKDELGAFL
jgi:hypothetical protein